MLGDEQMNKILLASHGPLAKAMKETAELFTGPTEKISSLCAYVDAESMDAAALVDRWFRGRSPEDAWIVVTDVYGGSINNEFMTRVSTGEFLLLSGMHLGLVIELACGLDALDFGDVQNIVARSREGIVYCNDLFSSEEEDEDF